MDGEDAGGQLRNRFKGMLYVWEFEVGIIHCGY